MEFSQYYLYLSRENRNQMDMALNDNKVLKGWYFKTFPTECVLFLMTSCCGSNTLNRYMIQDNKRTENHMTEVTKFDR